MSFIGRAPGPDELRGVKYLFTDIDDTLTTGGRLLAQTYQALWDLYEAGIAVVPVTGGSAGWCEHIVRAWPVAAVIGESGALAIVQDNGRLDFKFWEGEALQKDRQNRHMARILPMLTDGPEAFALAHDQGFRMADIAIDIGGHSREAIDTLANRIRALGARAAVSSIHINTWIGDYDKKAMSERLLHEHFGLSADQIDEQTAFVGDSRNDAPMFGYIRNSFGVANIQPYLPELPKAPRWISEQHSGMGFVDIARCLLDAKRKRARTG